MTIILFSQQYHSRSVGFLLSLFAVCSSFCPKYLSRPNNEQSWHSSSALRTSSRSLSSNDNNNEIVCLEHIERVFCISDLHVDHPDNLKWLADANGTSFGESDLIVVAGDISHELDRLKKSFEYLLQGGSSVVFVSGNHEAWLNLQELEDDDDSSLKKLRRIYDTCETLGVHTTGCLRIGAGSASDKSHTLWIAPLESWYDGTLAIEGCEDLCSDFGRWPWVDFIRCRWPEFPPMGDVQNKKIPSGLAQYFADLNLPLLKTLESSVQQQQQQQQSKNSAELTTSQTQTVMTVSHFLPNQQCLPDWKDLQSSTFMRESWLDHGGGGVSAKFAKVAGTKLLDEQIRGLDLPENVRQIHLFGHSHRPKDFVMKGIRYIHNPLGKPREREIFMVSPEVEFQLVWDSSRGEIPGETVIRYWEEKGGGVEALHFRMLNSKRKSRYGKHFKMHHRQGATESASNSSRLNPKYDNRN